MLITLHRNAATTPRQRAYIRASDKSVATLAHELGVSETTIRRWRGRSDPADRSSRPHRLATSLSNEEAEIADWFSTETDPAIAQAVAKAEADARTPVDGPGLLPPSVPPAPRHGALEQ